MLCVAAWCQSANFPSPAAVISKGRLLARQLLKALHSLFGFCCFIFCKSFHFQVIVCLITLQNTKGNYTNKETISPTRTEAKGAVRQCKIVCIAYRRISKKWFISTVKTALSSFTLCLSLSPPPTTTTTTLHLLPSLRFSVNHLSCCQDFTSQTSGYGYPALKLVQRLICTPHTNIQHLRHPPLLLPKKASISHSLSLPILHHARFSLRLSSLSRALHLKLNRPAANLS